jgi:hypothetical protein
MQGIRARDDRREMVADQRVANSFQTPVRPTFQRGERQRSSFASQVEAPRLQFREQAEMNARKHAELRDIAQQALAEKNAEFGL